MKKSNRLNRAIFSLISAVVIFLGFQVKVRPALFEKVGGYDLPNSSYYLFINTFPDTDKVGDMWNDAEKIAGVKIGDMEDYSLPRLPVSSS